MDAGWELLRRGPVIYGGIKKGICEKSSRGSGGIAAV